MPPPVNPGLVGALLARARANIEETVETLHEIHRRRPSTMLTIKRNFGFASA